jgi:hypothetical protein
MLQWIIYILLKTLHAYNQQDIGTLVVFMPIHTSLNKLTEIKLYTLFWLLITELCFKNTANNINTVTN